MTSRFAPPVSTYVTRSAAKRELMEQARRAGWKGKSYRKAKRFDRMLTRLERAGGGARHG